VKTLTERLEAIKLKYNEEKPASFFALLGKQDVISDHELREFIQKVITTKQWSIHEQCFHPEYFMFYHCAYLSIAEFNFILDEAIAESKRS
jgi:hypothetical protein